MTTELGNSGNVQPTAQNSRSTSEEHLMTHEAEAAVVDDQPVQLWRDGITITVSSRDVAKLQQQGWLTRSPEDIPLLLDLVSGFATEVVTNVKAFVEGVTADGYIDTQDGGAYAAALLARSLLDQRMQELVVLIHNAYPMRQTPPSSVDHNGETHSHDPSQTPLVDPEGNLRLIDPAQADGLKAVGWKEPA